MSDRPLILVSNDDGHSSEGIRALVGALEDVAEIVVVAPEAEQSAAAHAISIHRPLRLRQIRAGWYAVDGHAHRLLLARDQPPAARQAPGADGLGHQPWPEPGRRRHLLRHRRRGDGGLDHGRAGHRLQPGGPGQLRLRPRRALRARAGRGGARATAAAAPAAERERAGRAWSPTATWSPASASTPTAPTWSSRRIPAAASTTGSAATSTSTRTFRAATATPCCASAGSP